jgi:hypothetical protein
MKRHLLVVSMLALLGPLSLYAQEGERCRARDDESPNVALQRCSKKSEETLNLKETVPMAGTNVPKVIEETVEEAGSKVLAQASSAAATDASGSRVSDSLSDLLPLLQGAITPVNTSGEGEPVVLNFNSPPFLGGKTSLQATLVEPKIFAPLEEKFGDATHETESKILLDRAGGFGDATYSLGWSPVRRAKNWLTTKRLFGREMATYLPLINEYANDVLLPKFTERATAFLVQGAKELQPAGNDLAKLLDIDFDTVMATSFADLRKSAGSSPDPSEANRLIDGIKDQIESLAAIEMEAQATLTEREELSDKFAALVGNQPVLQVRTSYRDADPAVGPRDLAVTVEYSAGMLNFNRLLEEYQGLIDQRPDTSGKPDDGTLRLLKGQAFDNIAERAAKGDLWRTSYAITYKKISDYDETFEYDLDDVKKTFDLAVPGIEQWQLRINYSQLAGPDLFAPEVRPRIEFSVEGIWNQEDGDIEESMRRNDRILGRITYTVAGSDNMTFPVSVVFANRPEFLMEDKDLKNKLSMHVGLSYKLPRPKAIRQEEE